MISYKQCIEVLAIYRMIRQLKTRVKIHRFQYIIDVIDLTCLEEAALSLAIAIVIEQFRTDRNENRFKMNLKEVALSVIRDIRNKDDDDDDDDYDYDYIEYHD